MTRTLLAFTGGHSFDRTAFGGLLDNLTGWTTTWVEQPAGDEMIRSGAAAGFDALLCYDMPGISVSLGRPIESRVPDEALEAGWHGLLDNGTGVVFLHHALAGWPAWPWYAEVVGGIFLYEPGTVRGVPTPDSGYREDAAQQLRVVADHPITRGVPPTFSLASDEPYLCPIFEDSVEVLVRRTEYQEAHEYLSSNEMVLTRTERPCSDLPAHRASDAAVWVKQAHNSRVAYLQPGDNGVTFADTNYLTLLSNALTWVSDRSEAPLAHVASTTADQP